MQLAPKQPPGRANRKALRYSADIRQLSAEGYSFEAIRLALLDVGITVSKATVIREASRPPSWWDEAHANDPPPFLAEWLDDSFVASVAVPPAPSLPTAPGAAQSPHRNTQLSSASEGEADLGGLTADGRRVSADRLAKAKAIATAFFSRIGRAR